MAINEVYSVPKITKRANNFRVLLAKGRNWLLFFFIVNLLFGCSRWYFLPTPDEYNLVKAQQRAIVLLRVTSIVDGEPYKPFRKPLDSELNIGLALGSFETGGEFRWVTPLRFLSAATRDEGWTFFVLKPGTYYLAASPPPLGGVSVSAYERGFDRVPRWRFDVPLNAKTIYIGTLYISGKGQKLLWEGKKMVSLDKQGMSVLNEEDLAKKVSSGHIPEFDGLETALMKHHEGPLILRTPKF